jgi:hypothetical protein
LLFAWLIFSQAKQKIHLLQNDYFRHMEIELKTEEIKYLFLGDNSQFSYTIRQVEITNALGTAVAALDEYFITDSAGEIYRLYKTKEGNWYELTEESDTDRNTIIRSLKIALDNCLEKY